MAVKSRNRRGWPVRLGGGGLHRRHFPRLELDDFDFRVARPDLFLKPRTRIIAAMAEQNRAGRNLPDEIQQIISARVCR